MPFDMRDGDRSPQDFIVVAASNYAPTPADQDCLDRLNNFVTSLLTTYREDGTSRSAELIRERDACLVQLRARAQELVAGTMTTIEVYLTTFQYQGRFEERIARLQAAFIVAPERDPQNSQIYVDVKYEISPGITAKEQLDLKRELDKAITVVKVVLAGRRIGSARNDRTMAKRHEYIRALVNIGRIGLMEGNTQLATSTLETLRDEFVAREAARIKNHYVRRLGLWSAVLILVFAIAYLYIRNYDAGVNTEVGWRLWLLDTENTPTHPCILYRFRNFVLLAIGASFSAWLAFLIRRPTLGFTDLVQLDDDLLNPVTRVLFTIGLGFVVGLLFWTGMVSITVGTFSTNFVNSGTTAMLIGAFCGIASRALATAVSRRAEDFAGNVGGAAPPAGARTGSG